MKKVKMAVMALAAVSSIGSAFAFSPAAKTNATTYYAVKQGSSFVWTSTQPRSLSCKATTMDAVCSIITSTPPQDGVVPANHESTSKNVYQ